MSYQETLHEISPDVNPAGAEAFMRVKYGTLDHLPRETFEDEVRLASKFESDRPGTLRALANLEGMRDDFERWEAEPNPRPRPKKLTFTDVLTTLNECREQGGQDAVVAMARLLENHGDLEYSANEYVRRVGNPE